MLQYLSFFGHVNIVLHGIVKSSVTW